MSRSKTVAFRSAQDRLDAILAAAPDGILLCDEHGRILMINEEAARMFGYASADLVGKAVEALIPERLHERHIEERRAYVANPLVRPMGLGRDLLARRADGTELPVEISLAPLNTDEGLLVVNIVRDVSERRRLQAELKRRNDELTEADRRKDEFLATLSHELRNPLAPIRSAVDVLRHTRCEEPDVSWATGVIARQVDQMSRLIDDLLDVSRITRGKVRLTRAPVKLADVISSAIETSRPLFEGHQQALDLRLPDGEVWLDGDAVRLAQVVSNLLNNAAKYSDEGSPITLSAEIVVDRVAIRVRDRGMGIAAEFLPRIFDTFAQADRSLDRAHGGLGIGLTLVKSLVEMHGGTVEARSAGVGHGSEFEVRLPLAGAPAHAVSPPTLDPPPAPPRALKILVADDNVDFAESVGRLLKRRGHAVKLVHDGTKACAEAETFVPDAALIDIGLPGMNGFDVARTLRAHPATRGVLLVAVSGYGRDEDRARSRESGFDEHLTKPVQLDALTALLAARARR